MSLSTVSNFFGKPIVNLDQIADGTLPFYKQVADSIRPFLYQLNWDTGSLLNSKEVCLGVIFQECRRITSYFRGAQSGWSFLSSIGDFNLDTIRDQAINGLDTKAIAQMFPENTNAVVTVVTSSVEQDGSKQTIIDFLHRAFIKGDLFCEQISYKGSDSIYQKCQKLPMKLTALPFSSSDPAIAELPHSLQTGALNALPPPPQIGPMINVNTVAKIAGGLLGSFALYKAVQNLRAEGAINKVRAVAWTAFAIVSFINVKG